MLNQTLLWIKLAIIILGIPIIETISTPKNSIAISKATGSIVRPKLTHRPIKIARLVTAFSHPNHRQIWQVAGNPLTPEDYYRSAERKYGKKDYRGALADFNRAISINSSLAIAYGSRGSLKHDRLKDRSGGITDTRLAARLFKQQGDLENHRTAIELLKKWQQTEKKSRR